MAKFRVYQAALNKNQRARLNDGGGLGAFEQSDPVFHELVNAYADLGMGSMGDRTADKAVRLAAENCLFKHTATINCDELHEVFEVGNIGPEEKITRFDGVNMYSISVGNVVIDDMGTAWFCDNMGWTELFETTRDELVNHTTVHEAA